MQRGRWVSGAVLRGALLLWIVSLLQGAFAAKPRESAFRPALHIPVDTMGYRAPGELYMLARQASASLDFLDERHLLFTFHESRLMRRDGHDQDQWIRAVVLELPSGKETATTEWRLHDRRRYAWLLWNGEELLRQGEQFFTTGPDLELHPVLLSPSTIQQTYVSPDGRTMVLESDAERHTPEEHARLAERAKLNGDEEPDEDVQVLFVDMKAREVRLTARTEKPGFIAGNATGFLTGTESKANIWELRFHRYEQPGGSDGTLLETVNSPCPPEEDFLNETTLFVLSCSAKSADRTLDAVSLEGKKLWTGRWRANLQWPTITAARDGSAFAIGWLSISHAVDTFDPLSDNDVQAQVIYVLDTRTGGLRMSVPLRPILSAGGNFALSPDGNRLAVLNGGALDIYDVPPAAPHVPGK